MSCSSTKAALRLTLLLATFLASCAFVASVVWMLRTQNDTFYYENYQLSRLNISLAKNNGSDGEMVSNTSQTLVKMEISIRRVEENSRRLKEYTRSLLWDNKDKSLWCILFKGSERSVNKNKRPGGVSANKNNIVVDEEFLDKLRRHKNKEDIYWHVRHGGVHHHARHKTQV